VKLASLLAAITANTWILLDSIGAIETDFSRDEHGYEKYITEYWDRKEQEKGSG
jgi:transposase